jgi:hypothetical protein
LSASYLAQGASLLLFAVPVTFNGLSVEIGWAILALAFAATGALTQGKLGRWAAVVSWALAVAHLAAMPLLGGAHLADLGVRFHIGATPITSLALRGWALALAGQIIACIAGLRLTDRDDRPLEFTLSATSVAATVLWLATTLVSLPPLGATAWLIAYVWLMVAADVLAPPARFIAHGLAVLAIAAAKWVVFDTLAQRLAPGWSANAYPIVANPLMGVGALLAATLAGVYVLRRRRLLEAMSANGDASGSRAVPVAMAVAAILAIGFSFEIDRFVERAVLDGVALAWPAWQLKQMAWTMLWVLALSALAAMVRTLEPDAGRRSAWFRRLWPLAALLVAKFVLVDTLAYRLMSGVGSATVVANFQTLTGAVALGGMLLIRLLARSGEQADRAGRDARLRTSFALLAAFLIAWMGTFEIDRAVATHLVPFAWSAGQMRQMAWSVWWAAAAIATLFGLTRWIDRDGQSRTNWPRALPIVLIALAAKYLLIDTLAPRLLRAPVLTTVVANFQALDACVILGSLVLLYVLPLPGRIEVEQRGLRGAAGFLIALVLLWAGTLEIDRGFHAIGPAGAATWIAAPGLAEQVALSIFWSAFAVACVGAGFAIRSAPLRYFGLTLLGLTVLKVMAIDLGQVSRGYRIVSFTALGLLMLGTSVLYGKLSPRLLGTGERVAA